MVSGLSSSRWSSGVPSMSHLPATLGGLDIRGRCDAGGPVHIQRPDSALDQLLLVDLDVERPATCAPRLAEHLVERLGLRTRAREAVEDDAAARLRLGQPVATIWTVTSSGTSAPVSR